MNNSMRLALSDLIKGHDLEGARMGEVFAQLMHGKIDERVASGFLCALATKGESAEELAAAARVMRDLSSSVPLHTHEHLVDTCGTGGDGAGLFNISTAAALVAAAGGARVAKHGNRAASSHSGSADALEQLGLEINLSAQQIGRCVDETGIGFMFAPLHHSAMKAMAPIRKALAVPTLFNLLGPLTNPAGAKRQLLGVGQQSKAQLMADTLARLGCEHALIVHSADGLDEISICAETQLIELKAGEISYRSIKPDDFSMEMHKDLQPLLASTPKQSADLIRAAIEPSNARNRHPASAIVALNGGAALYVASCSQSLKDGVHMAEDLLCSGQVKQKLSEWIECARLVATLT